MTWGVYQFAGGHVLFRGLHLGVAGVIAALLPAGHSAADVRTRSSQTVTPHTQSVGAWCTTGGVIDPAGAVALLTTHGVSIDAGGAGVGDYIGDAYVSGETPTR